jgi:hypothetical protein
MDLVKVALWLTSFGCAWLARQQEFVLESHKLRLQSETPRKTVVRGPLHSMTTETAPRYTPKILEDDFSDFEYRTDSIKDDALDDISRLQVTKGRNADIHRRTLSPVSSRGFTFGSVGGR